VEIRLKRVTWLIIVMALAVGQAAGRSQAAAGPKAIQAEVSIANIEATLHAIDVDRTAASDGERAAVGYIDRALTSYGITHRTLEARLWLSWPGRAELAIPGMTAMAGKTAAFAAPTPAAGVSGALVINPSIRRRVDLPAMPADGDEFGFLTTSLVRGRNVVEATLGEATAAIHDYLSKRQ